MPELAKPDQGPARQIVRNWLTEQNRSLRNLAKEAGMQPSVISRFLHGETLLEEGSALKLYGVMQQNLYPLDRKSFVETTGLTRLMAVFSRDTLFSDDAHAPAYDIGNRLMVAGYDMCNRAAHQAAIPLFRAAAQVLGTGSGQAAFAGCLIAQMFLNLGDYQQAQVEADQVQNTYSAVMDTETKAELYRIKNWVAYYRGHYPQSEQWLRERIKLGAEGGIERLTNPHFLGRVYYDLGCQAQSKKEADRLFQQAAVCFDQAYQIALRWADDHNQAFDRFRKAQVLQMQGQWQDAQTLRTQAKQVFSNGSIAGSIALLHVTLEEAKLLLEEGQIAGPKSKTEEVLRGWVQVKYPKGIGDALKVLGDLEYMQGNLECALQIFAARLCIYPCDHYPSNRQVWSEVHNLQWEIVRREGRNFYQQMIHRIQQLAEHRQGYFSYLDSITVDRGDDIARVMDKLQASFVQ